MEAMAKEDIRTLARHDAPQSLSILMPVQRPVPEAQQNPIRLKTLVHNAEEQLEALGSRSADVKRRLAPLRRLVDDPAFWEQRTDGLALFLGDDEPRLFRAPFPLDEVVVVGRRFHLAPLIRLLTDDGRFYVLSLSQHQRRLFAASRYDIRELDLGDVPENFEQAMSYTVHERHLEYHTRAPSHGSQGRRPAAYHGQGSAGDESLKKTRLLEYCQMIERGVHEALRTERAPLVLAAAEPLIGLYREANRYPGLAETVIEGNPEALPVEDLHARAADVVADAFENGRQQALDLYRQAAGTDRAASDLEHVLRAAHIDQIDRLLFARGVHRWGRFDPEEGSLTVHDDQQPGDDDLMNLAAVRTLAGGGVAFAIEPDQMPQEADVAAIFRFPTPGANAG